MPHWPEKSGGQGVHREVESEGLEEKHRAVIEGETPDESVGQRWGKVESAGTKALSFTHQGVCERHGVED